MAIIRSDILLKLLDIEKARCLSKRDDEERSDSLASLTEGGEPHMSIILSGLEKYMEMLFGPERIEPAVVVPPVDDRFHRAVLHFCSSNRINYGSLELEEIIVEQRPGLPHEPGIILRVRANMRM
jgi:hypothetical protein